MRRVLLALTLVVGGVGVTAAAPSAPPAEAAGAWRSFRCYNWDYSVERYPEGYWRADSWCMSRGSRFAKWMGYV